MTTGISMASGIGQPNESPTQGELAELGCIEDAFQQSLIVFRCPFLKLVFRNIWKGHIVTRIDDSDAQNIVFVSVLGHLLVEVDLL